METSNSKDKYPKNHSKDELTRVIEEQAQHKIKIDQITACLKLIRHYAPLNVDRFNKIISELEKWEYI